MSKYNVKELLTVIQEVEQDVSDLYLELSEKVNGKAKKVFEKLSKDELRHKEMYGKLISKLANNGEYDLDEDTIDYLNQLRKSNIFEQPELKKRLVKEDALLIAEKVEKDGILLYQELKNSIPELNSEELDVIISEEKSHLKSVMKMQFNATIPTLML